MSENYRVELAKSNFTKHGLKNTRLYNIWCLMKKRCYNSNYEYFHNYGGRGIIVCEEWKKDFKSFYDWSVQNGYTDDLTIDRINNDGNYCPENCRWVTRSVQNRNTRNCHYVTYNGETKTIVEWAEILGINKGTLWNRLSRLNWSVERAFNIKPIKGGHYTE